MRLSLDLAEEGIAVDPYHRDHRKEIDDIVWDTSEAGVAVAFAVLDGEIVFLAFVDVFNS